MGNGDGVTLVFGRDAICHYCATVHAIGLCPNITQSISAGEAAKRIGIQQVIAHEESDWPARAERWVLSLRPGAVFTADDVRAAIGEPERKNSIGARFHVMAAQGWIRPTGRTVKGKTRKRHAGRSQEWERIGL